MYDVEDIEDVDQLLFVAKALSDRLEVAAHSQRMRFFAVVSGIYATALAVLGSISLTFSDSVFRFRFADELQQIGPLLIISISYFFSVLCVAFYRLSIDKTYLRLARSRLQAVIVEAEKLDSSEHYYTKSASY